MLSGKEALNAIDETLQRVRSDVDDGDRLCAAASAELAELERRELGIFTRLAHLRLLAIERGDLLQSLDDADRRTGEILGERNRARIDNEHAIEAAESELSAYEQRRTDQQAVVATETAAVDAAEALAQQRLAASPEYQAQLEHASRTDFVADQAEDKADAAQRDRVDKGRPYEQDPLFSYLWDRGYGTSAYRAWPLTRWLDARVARLCGYETARRNYALLTDIPVRLKDHAMKMRAASDREIEALQKLEQRAAEQADVPARQAILEVAEQALSTIDDSIAGQEDRIHTLVAERGRFAAGTDDYSQRGVELLRHALQRSDIGLLRERATRTPDPEDDELVEELAALTGERARVEEDLDQFQRLQRTQQARLKEFEDLRRRFKAKHYDALHSEFANGALIHAVLAQFLSGAVHSSDVWETIRRQQRHHRIRSDPYFGTMRFPRTHGSGPWRFPGGSGGFGGGGFRGGGGFGGGGFKSGGGF